MKDAKIMPKGILNPTSAQRNFTLVRHPPQPDLAYFVEQYWIVRWTLNEPFISHTLAYPSVHISIEPDVARVVGIVTGRFTVRLEREGRVFGIKFRPGAFYPFVCNPIAELTDQSRSLTAIFGDVGQAYERDIRATQEDAQCIAIAGEFLRACQPDPDPVITPINEVIEQIIADPTIHKVDDLVAKTYFSKRTLQRLFHQYVGVSPKWVINRFRLHEAADRVATGQNIDWAKLAVDLGYYDQAHFIKDFKAIVGCTPLEYARSVSATPGQRGSGDGVAPA
jgi:AraC-like DNA-binding protein